VSLEELDGLGRSDEFPGRPEGGFQLSTADAPPPRRSRSDGVRNRQLALDATKLLLAQGGSAVTVEAIARQAGLGAGTVVRAFGGKEQLVDAAVADLL
jgi:AcrR family transcriptional regulator